MRRPIGYKNVIRNLGGLETVRPRTIRPRNVRPTDCSSHYRIKCLVGL